MPELVRLYIRNIAFGLVLSILFVAGLLWLDVAHLRHLILTSDMGWVAVAMLVLFNAVVFSGVQFAIAIMRMAEPQDGGTGGKRVRISGEPVRIKAVARMKTGPRR